MTLKRSLQGIVLLALAGLGISLYLTWAYTANVAPICGASGGCATVQNSEYAWIAGIPIPMLGALGYTGMLALAVLALRLEERRELLLLALFGATLIGVLFSAYLTYIEFFVIYAICRWCIASAIVMLLAFVASLVAYRRHQAE
ncbi:MAG TPA: vitamin K epoxide reductase family protein [Symbiobacteriaceae bacterium]|nr:vitamin K epoxide reductase family protein [Symbiobacteriaceae bacterium]